MSFHIRRTSTSLPWCSRKRFGQCRIVGVWNGFTFLWVLPPVHVSGLVRSSRLGIMRSTFATSRAWGAVRPLFLPSPSPMPKLKSFRLGKVLRWR